MLDRILTVGGYTLLSRLTGFMRDIMLAAILGAGPTADAFFVAFRLPNHFRAIFAEGAFNAAFIPAYARVRTQEGKRAADQFGDRIFTLLFASQVVLLALALLFTPQVIELLAPGFSREPHQFALAVSLIAAVIFGLVPALRASKVDQASAILLLGCCQTIEHLEQEVSPIAVPAYHQGTEADSQRSSGDRDTQVCGLHWPMIGRRRRICEERTGALVYKDRACSRSAGERELPGRYRQPGPGTGAVPRYR